MGSINSAFSIISGALDADQAALSIVAGNVANANTPGYTQERPQFRENTPVTIAGVSLGAGVTQAGAISIRDRVLSQRLNQQQQLASASSVRLAALDSMQSLFTPNSGSAAGGAGDIGSDITAFFSSFSSLETNPTNNALRQQVLSKGALLSSDVSRAAASLNAQRASLDQEAGAVAGQVNALTKTLSAINLQIESSSPGNDAGQLEDQRQLYLSQLSQLIGIHCVTTENNGIAVTTTAGQTLVAGGTATAVNAGVVDGATHFFIGDTDVTADLTSGEGELGGYLTARDQDIPRVLASLDELAYGTATAVNTQNAGGMDLNGSSGAPIFAVPAQVTGSAAKMAVIMTDPNGIAAAAAGAGGGDNSNAIALSELATQPAASNLNGLTPSNFYAGFVATLGGTVSQVEAQSTAQSASVSQLQSQSDSLSGVNLNDEASALTTLERSYQAASQVFAILNTIMASALNLGNQTSVS